MTGNCTICLALPKSKPNMNWPKDLTVKSEQQARRAVAPLPNSYLKDRDERPEERIKVLPITVR